MMGSSLCGTGYLTLVREVSNQSRGPSLRFCLKTCQIKSMSKQEPKVPSFAGGRCCPPAAADGAECCAPLACEPLPESGAEELASLFKAVADPMRLRLLSLIACHDGGESCVCDLT